MTADKGDGQAQGQTRGILDDRWNGGRAASSEGGPSECRLQGPPPNEAAFEGAHDSGGPPLGDLTGDRPGDTCVQRGTQPVNVMVAWTFLTRRASAAASESRRASYQVACARDLPQPNQCQDF